MTQLITTKPTLLDILDEFDPNKKEDVIVTFKRKQGMVCFSLQSSQISQVVKDIFCSFKFGKIGLIEFDVDFSAETCIGLNNTFAKHLRKIKPNPQTYATEMYCSAGYIARYFGIQDAEKKISLIGCLVWNFNDVTILSRLYIKKVFQEKEFLTTEAEKLKFSCGLLSEFKEITQRKQNRSTEITKFFRDCLSMPSGVVNLFLKYYGNPLLD